MDINDLYNFVNFWSKSGQQPGTASIVNDTRDLFKETGKLVDDYALGGTFQANMRGRDELLKQLLINSALMGAGAGVGKGLGVAGKKFVPKIGALRQWIKPRDIGVHISPYENLDRIMPNLNINKGAGEIPGFPLIEGQTYKLSSTDAYAQKLNPNELINSVENYLPNVRMNPMGNKNIYVTKSPTGRLDPEHEYWLGLQKSGNTGNNTLPASLNARMAPSQTVVGSKTLPVTQTGNKIDDALRNELAKLISKQQSLEKVKSLGRGAFVGGSAVGTALTPLTVARPALGFNNKNKKK
jgi:hypothetical protein